MTTDEKPSPVLRRSKFQIDPWDGKDFVVLLVNGMLLLFVVVCSGKLVFEMLLGNTIDDRTELWIAIALTGIAYIYSFLFGFGSVRVFEKDGGVTNVTQFMRFYAVIYFIGFGVTYWVVILKLAEQDYIREGSHRFIQYIVILFVSYIAVRLIAAVPKTQDVWLLAAVIFISNLIHATSIVFQYIFAGGNDLAYFFRDVGVLAGMAILAILTLFGSWKVE